MNWIDIQKQPPLKNGVYFVAFIIKEFMADKWSDLCFGIGEFTIDPKHKDRYEFKLIEDQANEYPVNYWEGKIQFLHWMAIPKVNIKYPDKTWVLVSEVNEYDQHGQYFMGAWPHQPTKGQIIKCIYGIEEQDAGEYQVKIAEHILNGGGRIDTEWEWYTLKSIDFETHPPRSSSIRIYEPHAAPVFYYKELKDCPSCGAKPHIYFKGNQATKTRSVMIKCPSCRLQRTDATIRNTAKWTAKVCIDHWNKRTD